MTSFHFFKTHTIIRTQNQTVHATNNPGLHERPLLWSIVSVSVVDYHIPDLRIPATNDVGTIHQSQHIQMYTPHFHTQSVDTTVEETSPLIDVPALGPTTNTQSTHSP